MLVRIQMDPGKPPSTWPQEYYADVDGTEPFIYRIGIGVLKLLDASLIEEPKRAEVKHAIVQLLMEGFIPAFDQLSKIKALVRPPEMNRRQAYEHFMGTLWQGYKNFLPKATREMGFDIGFLFQEAAKFEKGITRFRATHPTVPKDFDGFLRLQKDGWQKTLSDVRNNYREHRKLDWDDVKEFYCVEQAEKFFESAWTAAEDILACLIYNKFPPQFGIREIPLADRNPKYPDRFEFLICQPIDPSAGT
jgi:hypothetical protein